MFRRIDLEKRIRHTFERAVIPTAENLPPDQAERKVI